MDRELVYLAKELGAPELKEEFSLLEKRLKDAPVPDDEKAMLWAVENAQARMVLKQKVYELAGRVREVLGVHQLAYASIDSTIKDYCEKLGGDPHTDLPKLLLDELVKLESLYKKLQKNIEGKKKLENEALEFMRAMRLDFYKVVKNNPPWQQTFDFVNKLIGQACECMDSLNPKLNEWSTIKVNHLPDTVV